MGTEAQWQSFMADAGRVLGELRIDMETRAELLAILAGFKDQCVLKGGEAAPPDPNMCRARPSGGSGYAQLGGVYPIALFADRVVEAVLQGDRVQVAWNRLDDPSGTRHPPGLKYMFTELFCNSAGGPEVVTSKGVDEAKLGIHPNQWQAFLALVAEAAAVWPTKHHRDLVLRICASSKVEICAGLEGETSPGVDGPVPASDALPRCPFSGSSGGHCPFSGAKHGAAASSLSLPPSESRAPTVQACTSSWGGQSSVSEGITEDGSQMPTVGKVLGSSLQQKLDGLLDEDPDLCCPVSLMVFAEPVIASDGFIYEKSSLMTLLRNRQASPITREVLKPEHRAAQQKKLKAEDFRQKRSRALLHFAREAAPKHPEMSATALDRASDYLKTLRTDQSQALAREAAELSAQLAHST